MSVVFTRQKLLDESATTSTGCVARRPDHPHRWTYASLIGVDEQWEMFTRHRTPAAWRASPVKPQIVSIKQTALARCGPAPPRAAASRRQPPISSSCHSSKSLSSPRKAPTKLGRTIWLPKYNDDDDCAAELTS